MQRALNLRIASVLFGGLLLMGASVTATARFAADQPGADLRPIGAAEQLISLVQGQNNILWVSTTGTVSDITVRGWPVEDGEVELGGGLSITQPDGGDAGVVTFDEKPMSVEFSFDG